MFKTTTWNNLLVIQNGSSKRKRNKKKQGELNPSKSNSLQEANNLTMEKKSEELNGALGL